MQVNQSFPDTVPTEADVLLARESSRKLSELVTGNHPLRVNTSDDGQQTIEIPAVAARLLVRLLTEMAQGNAVTLIPIHAELTTQQAADLLGVSRPFVVKQIEDGFLPGRKVGAHRRILFQDLMAYKKRIDAERQAALVELAKLDQELGLE
ncbi:MAG: helix-turn-helix domain-containing protein [Planctomycetota bacterium]